METTSEPNGLGEPILPTSGRIPIYVAADGTQVEYGTCPTKCWTLAADEYGLAVPVAPFRGSTSSGVVLINQSKAFKGNLVATVAHEFFHVLEFAHSYPAAESWIGEATATWAEHVYAPRDKSRGLYFNWFQEEPGSLMTTNGTHEYGAEVWLLWLQQKRAGVPSGAGGEAAVFGLWQKLEAASSDDVAGLIDSVISWSTEFKNFAVEDLNQQLGAVTPIVFNEADPQIAVGKPPAWAHNSWTVSLGKTQVFLVTLDPLEAQYDWARRVDGQVRYVLVTVDSQLLQTGTDFMVLAKISGEWKAFTASDGQLAFCRNRPGEDISQLYVIVDDHSYQPTHQVTGSYSVSGAAACPTPTG